jgi:hypothetical protein
MLVNVSAFAEGKAGKRAQIGHLAIAPPESVGLPGDDGREPDHFAATVETAAHAARPAERAKVGDRVGYVLVLRQGLSLGKNKSAECNEQPSSFHVLLLA